MASPTAAAAAAPPAPVVPPATQDFSYVDARGDFEHKKISLWGAVMSFCSSLRAGQDLTRTTMPACFLRPYSILEVLGFRMMSYIDLLFELNEIDDPVQRMTLVTAFYVSNLKQEIETFYKKPYNPIHGETHQCHVDSTKYGRTDFVAEQVSHHPPISAVHVWNEQQQVRVTTNASFNVKFFTNSVGVENVGFVRMEIGKHKESYVSANCLPPVQMNRVIWGKRVIHWVGNVEIACKETGLKSNISLVIGTDKHETNTYTGSITRMDAPDTPLYTFSGETGYKMHLTKAGAKDSQLLLSIQDRPKNKIVYPSLAEQEPTESLRVWAATNKCIFDDDMDAADAAKTIVEDGQRLQRAAGVIPPLQHFHFDPRTKLYEVGEASDEAAAALLPSASDAVLVPDTFAAAAAAAASGASSSPSTAGSLSTASSPPQASSLTTSARFNDDDTASASSASSKSSKKKKNKKRG